MISFSYSVSIESDIQQSLFEMKDPTVTASFLVC